MYSISFKNRIALYYSISTALLISAVFILIFFTVKAGVYNDLDNDLNKELHELFSLIEVKEKSFTIIDQEWEEKEHQTLNINPIFIQLTDNKGKILKKSPNLKSSSLYVTASDKVIFLNSTLNNFHVRQVQAPVKHNGNIIGYIVSASPSDDAESVLQNLRNTLLIAYPIILLILFSIARLLAGRSIVPIKNIINTANKISQENLKTRIAYPHNKDELYTLADTINNLLERIEDVILREKQFTSDASHELRTPLAVIKGTLEVLLRKPRNIEEYEEKISFCISEVDRISTIVDQLLLLARLESHKGAINLKETDIGELLLESVSRHSAEIERKQISLSYSIEPDVHSITDKYLLDIILENLLSNAIKYSPENSKLTIGLSKKTDAVELTIKDSGIGISNEDLDKIFNPFYRSEPNKSPHIKGVGLGLSIVKRLCELLKLEINIKSEYNQGTFVTIFLPFH